jgi:hypothetical protein
MDTNPEVSQHYPKQIELDETLVQSGPQFLRLKPGGLLRQIPTGSATADGRRRQGQNPSIRAGPSRGGFTLFTQRYERAGGSRRLDREYRAGRYVHSPGRAGRRPRRLRQPACESATMDTKSARSASTSPRSGVREASAKVCVQRYWRWPAHWS